MKAQHSRGPWVYKIHPRKVENGGILPGGGSIQHPTDKVIFGRPVTDVVCYMPHFYKDDEQPEIEANAKLMAAAPELLKALEKLVKEVTIRCQNVKDFSTVGNSMTEARAAIYKAIGE